MRPDPMRPSDAMPSARRARAAALLLLIPALVATAALVWRELDHLAAIMAARPPEFRSSLLGYWLRDVPMFALQSSLAAIDGFHLEALWRWAAAALALLWMGGLARVGRALRERLKRLGVAPANRCEGVVGVPAPPSGGLAETLDAALGFTLVGLLVLAIGLAGVAMRPLLGAFCLAGCASGAWAAVRAVRGYVSVATYISLRTKDVYHNYGACATGLALAALVYALAPATQSDGLRYHLGALSEWMKDGQIVLLPHLSFASFPFLVEMHYFVGMGLFRDPIAAGVFAKVCHWTLFVWSLRAVGTLAAAFAPVETCNAGALSASRAARFVYAATPSAAILAGWSFIDHGIVFLYLATLLAVLELGRSDRARLDASRAALLAGALAGGLVGTKYTMLLPAGLLALGAGWLTCGALTARLRVALLFSVAAAFVGGPWLLKNVAQTGGNPIYPASLAGRLPTPGWSEECSALLAGNMALKGASFDPATGDSRPYPAWQLPWRLVVQWTDFEAQFLGLLPLFGLLAPLALLAARRGRPSREAWFVALLAAAFLVAWVATYRSARLLLPAAALGAAAVGVTWAALRADPVARRLAGVAVGLHAALGIGFVAHWLLVGQQPAPLPVALGLQREEVYLEGALSQYAAIRRLNDLTAITGDGALLIGEHRPYYFEGRVLFADWFNPPVLRELFERYRDNEALFAGLRADGIGYIFFNARELALYRGAPRYFADRLGPGGYGRFLALERYLADHPELAVGGADAENTPGIAIYRLPESP